MGGSYTMMNDFPTGDYPQNPNLPGDEDRTQWSFKASGSYDAPFGIRLSPVIRHQSGANFARTFTVAAPAGSGLTASGTAYAEPIERQPRRQHLGVRRPRREEPQPRLAHASASLLRRVQPDQQPRVGNDQPRDRPRLPEAAARSWRRSPTRVGFRLIF